MSEFIKLFKKIIFILFGSILLGGVLLTIVYILPVNTMEDHVTSSINIFVTESVYPQQIQGYKTTQLDNETDAIMLLGAIYENKDLNPLQKAMAVPHATLEGVSSLCITLKNILWDRQEADGFSYYDRYWHGYMLYLKPLLLVMDYGDIRMFNMIIQLNLLLLLSVEMVKKKLHIYIPALILTLAVLNPAAISMSLQFSAIYYIILISLIILLRYKDILIKDDKLYIFFLMIGIAVAYFDFLTYPVAAFGIPAILTMIIYDGNWKEKIKTVILLGICWVIGYLGMWAGKWVISSIVLNKNVFVEAFSRITVHSSETYMEGVNIGAFGALWKNVKVLLKWPYFLMGFFYLVYYLRKIVRNFKFTGLIQCTPFVIICFIPCIWIMILSSHSAWCYWYTYRNLSASVFSVSVIVCRMADSKRELPLESQAM